MDRLFYFVSARGNGRAWGCCLYQRRKPEEPAYKWNILWYVEMLVLFSNSNRLFSHTSGLQVREVEYQNIIYRVHALHCASNKAFCLRKNKQTNKNNNYNHEENSLQQHSLQQKQSNWKTNVFGIIGERSYTMIRRKFSIPLSSFHQKADNRTCLLSTMSKMSFPSAGKKNQTSVKTMPWLILALCTPLILKRLSSELVQTYSK